MNWTAAAFLLMTATPAAAQDEIIGVRVREWFARMGGTIEADDGSGTSETIDLGADLGLADRNLTHELQAYLRIPVLGRIYLGWWQAHDSGSETLTRTFDFMGVQFTASTQVDTDVTLDVGYLTYELALPTIPLVEEALSFEIGLQVSGRVIRGKGSISESTGGQSAADDGIIGFPTLGGHVTVTLLSVVRAEVEVVGLAVAYGSARIRYIEAFGEVVAQPLPWLFAGVGYKMTNLDFRAEGTQRFVLDVTVSGLYITAGVRF